MSYSIMHAIGGACLILRDRLSNSNFDGELHVRVQSRLHVTMNIDIDWSRVWMWLDARLNCRRFWLSAPRLQRDFRSPLANAFFVNWRLFVQPLARLKGFSIDFGTPFFYLRVFTRESRNSRGKTTEVYLSLKVNRQNNVHVSVHTSTWSNKATEFNWFCGDENREKAHR